MVRRNANELEPLPADEEGRAHVGDWWSRSNGERPRLRRVRVALLAIALFAVGWSIGDYGGARNGNEENARLTARVEQMGSLLGDYSRDLAQLRRRTRLPAVDPGSSRAMVIPAGASKFRLVMGILIAPDDFSKVWLIAEGTGGEPDRAYGLAGGLCTDREPTPDWAIGRSSDAGDVRLLAGPLRLDPKDPEVWVRLHSGGEDFGGVRGPLSSPGVLAPGESAC